MVKSNFITLFRSKVMVSTILVLKKWMVNINISDSWLKIKHLLDYVCLAVSKSIKQIKQKGMIRYTITFGNVCKITSWIQMINSRIQMSNMIKFRIWRIYWISWWFSKESFIQGYKHSIMILSSYTFLRITKTSNHIESYIYHTF